MQVKENSWRTVLIHCFQALFPTKIDQLYINLETNSLKFCLKISKKLLRSKWANKDSLEIVLLESKT